MRIVLDTNVLLHIASSRDDLQLVDPRTGQRIDRACDRLSVLIETTGSQGGTIVIPAPVLTEFLVGVEPAKIQEYIDLFMSERCIEVAPFDARAAVECAQMVDRAEHRQRGGEDETRAKVRFDRQILAIAKVVGATAIYTHDRQLLAKAESITMEVKSLADVPLPPEQDDWVSELSTPNHQARN